MALWWEPLVDLLTNVKVRVNNNTGDICLVDIHQDWKQGSDLPLDHLDLFTAQLQMAFHGFGGGSARMTELVEPTMFHCVYSNETSSCPCCRSCIETQQHLLLCSANTSRTQAIAKFRKTCRKRDTNKFKLVLEDVIAQWMVNPTTTPSSANRINTSLRYEHYPQAYIELIDDAICDQVAIGWMNMMRGFLSKKWHLLASTYFDGNDENAITNRNDGNIRIQQVIKALHTLTMSIWQGRNEVLHGICEADAAARKSATDLEIIKYHTEADMVLTDDRIYCEQSLHRLLHSSPSNKRRWLHRVKVSRAKLAQLHHRQPRITKYFTSRSSSYTDNSTNDTTTDADNDVHRNNTTQRLMSIAYKERSSNTRAPQRAKTTQQLLTDYLKERAPNTMTTMLSHPSPPPLNPEFK
jgi:hypothetical protein